MKVQRICSLLASSTEILYALGLGDRVVAVSHECDYPPEVESKPRISRTRVDENARSGSIDEQVRELSAHDEPLYELDVEGLVRLKPDLIVTQQQCDVCAVNYEDVQRTVDKSPELENCHIVALNPTTLSSVLEDVKRVGQAAGCAERAESVVSELRSRIDGVEEKTKGLSRDQRPRVVCLEWIDPMMVAANWMPELVGIAGGRYELAEAGHATGYTDWEKVVQFDPEVIVVAPCGFDLHRVVEECRILERLPHWSNVAAVEAGRLYAADGKAYFNRSGPRLVDSLEMLAHMIHPELFQADNRPFSSAWMKAAL